MKKKQKISDRLLSDMHRTKRMNAAYSYLVSDLLLSDKYKHPLTVLIGNEGMF